MVKDEKKNKHLKSDLLKKLDTIYALLVGKCVKSNGLFKEGYMCGLALDNKVNIICEYKNFNQCNYKKEEKDE